MNGSISPGMPALPPIAVAMAGIDPGAIGVGGSGGAPSAGDRVRALLAWLARQHARAVRIDATMPGIRPRELDRSGRRDLGALLRRSELAFAGLDLFIPPDHFLRPEHADRAISSTFASIDLAADLVGLAAGAVVTRLAAGNATSVSIVLPPKLPADIAHTLADHATTRGVRIANHAWPIADDGGASSGGGVSDAIGVGLDPATVLASGGDPIALAASLGRRLVCARLSDVAAGPMIGSGRTAPGSGRLDVTAYRVTLATMNYDGPVILDLGGLRDPGAAIRTLV